MNPRHRPRGSRTTPLLREPRSISVPRERRAVYRAKVMRGMELDADVRCGLNMVWPGKVVNLSRQGALLEFSKDNVPALRVDEQVSVKLRCKDDVVWVAGVVRHRHGNRLGIFFSELLDQGTRSTEHAIFRILRAIERSWLHKHVC